MAGVATLIVAVLVLVCIPCPQVDAVFCTTVKQKYSWNLQQWKDRGEYFTYQGKYKLFYVDAKSKMVKEGAPLLAVHGFPTAGFDWSKMLPCLLERFPRVIVVDLLGYGFSDKPKYHVYKIKEHALMNEAILEHLGIKEVHAICHDVGDPVCQEMLDSFNERKKKNKLSSGLILKSMTLLNGAILPERLHPTIIQQAMLVPFFAPFIRVLVNYCLYRFGAYPLYSAYNKPTEQDFIDLYLLNAYNDGAKILPLTHNFYREQIYFRKRLGTALKETSIPCHIIQGRQDPVNPYPFEVAARKEFPKISLDVLPENGHYCHWENPERVCYLYKKFLDKHFGEGKV